MEQAVKKLFLAVLVLTAFPVSADLDNPDLYSPGLNNPDLDDPGLVKAEMAKVVTQKNLPADCLAPVEINRIDGEMRVLPAQGFDIERGVHIINGRATLDTTKCHPMDSDQQFGGEPGLAVNFEAGVTYYIAYDRSSPNTEEWKLVVWNVEYPEPPPDYIQPLDSIQ